MTQKPLPMLNAATHEFSYVAALAMKANAAVKALEFHLNAVTERLNEITEEQDEADSRLHEFKKEFLSEIIALLAESDSLEDPEEQPLDVVTRVESLEIEQVGIAEILANYRLRNDKLEARVTALEEARGDNSNTDLFDL